jgi:hypothetical protein
MRRLRPNMECSLAIEDAWITCLVVGVHREAALLQPVNNRRFHALVGQAKRAELSFHDRHRRLVMLTGVALIDQRHNELRFVVTDNVQLPEPRETLRVDLELEATVVPVDADGRPAGPQATTTTVDLSCGGMTLRDAPALDGGEAFDVRIALPGDDATPLELRFHVLRRGRGTLHGRFDAERPVLTRVEEHLLEVRRAATRREIARRAATQRDAA